MAPRVFLLCLALVVPPLEGLLAGDLPGLAAQKYRITQWTAEHGLPESHIKALAQTRDGYLWIGTLSGLARFDGESFKVFDHSNTPGMTHDAINDLSADNDDGSLWIMTQGELMRFRDQTFQRYGTEHGFSGLTGQLWPARDGGVWVVPGPGRIARVRGQGLQEWDVNRPGGSPSVTDIVEDLSGQLLLLLSGEVIRYDLDSRQQSPVKVPAPTAACSDIFLDRDQSLWLCTGDALWHSTNRNWTQVSSKVPNLEQVYRTSDGQIWATQHKEGRASLQWLVDGKLQDFVAPEFPPEANVTRLLEDREGSLWVGTTLGLLQLTPKRIRVYSRQNGLASDNVLSLAVGREGSVWVGTAEGVSKIGKGEIRNLPSPEPGAGWYRVTTLLADRQNDLWVGWKKGTLARWDQTQWQLVTVPGALGNTEHLRAIKLDREGSLWVGTGLGVFCQKGDRWSHYCTTNGLPLNDVRVIHQDRRGDMWFGTYGKGLSRLHNGRLTTYATTNGSYNNRAWWIHEDTDGVFWIGSQEGLNRFVPPNDSEPKTASSLLKSEPDPKSYGRFFTFTTRQGLHENVVNNIQEDQFGYLWLSGLRGVYRVARRELNQVATGQARDVTCLAYGEADGMLSSECNGGEDQPAGCRDPAGHIWFPTARGVIEIDPAKNSRSEVAPPIIIEEVKADGGPLLLGETSGTDVEEEQWPAKVRARVPPGKAHVLEFHYSAPTFVDAERAQFRYRLVGAEQRWREPTDQRTVSYVGLRPGRYRFEVAAANHHGVWSPQPAGFTFLLEPHFWQTWTFYGFCIAGTVGAVALIQAYRLKWQHRLLKLQEQHALANERARIARDLHDDLGTALTGLALQLDVARREAGANLTLANRFSQTANKARELAERMREVVWTINPRCDTVSGVATFLEQQVTQFLHADGLAVKLDFPEDIPATPLGAQARHQMALSVREALTNVVRHSRATEVVVSLSILEQELLLEVKDNGCGFQAAENPGHGLANMRTRMEQVDGTFECTSSPGSGTVLRFRLPFGQANSIKDKNR